MTFNLIRKGYHYYKFLHQRIRFRKDLTEFKKKRKYIENEYSKVPIDLFPCLNEATKYTEFDAHYFYHPIWAFKKVLEINPAIHIDISSILIFSGMLSNIIPVKYFDYRPADITLPNLKSDKADLLKLPFENNSVESLSCMHTIEHVGLGRYGDPINPNGDLEAIKELKRVTAQKGNLLFVVPIGKPKIYFNAHRIYSYEQIIKQFEDFELKEYCLITDNKKFIIGASEILSDKQNYGCGCFWFVKKS